MSVLHMHPALRTWRREVRDGRRRPDTFDALWAAACEETSAEELLAAELPTLARARLDEAWSLRRCA